MLINDLINTNLPSINPADTIRQALQIISEFSVNNIPVVSEKTFLGNISETELLEANNDNDPVSSLAERFSGFRVKNSSHFLSAVNISAEFGLDVIPVVNSENEYAGAVLKNDLFLKLAAFNGAGKPGSIIVVEIEFIHFSISEISRLVESNNSTILHLNTSAGASPNYIVVSIQINNTEGSAIVSTFERYNYRILYFDGGRDFENKIHDNYEHLMNYLSI